MTRDSQSHILGCCPTEKRIVVQIRTRFREASVANYQERGGDNADILAGILNVSFHLMRVPGFSPLVLYLAAGPAISQPANSNGALAALIRFDTATAPCCGGRHLSAFSRRTNTEETKRVGVSAGSFAKRSFNRPCEVARCLLSMGCCELFVWYFLRL